MGRAEDFILSLAQQAFVGTFVLFAGIVYLKVGSRRLFRVYDKQNVTVIVAASATTFTGTYQRSSTGIGQVRAMASLSHRFATAYSRCRLDQVFTADAQLHDRITGDLVSLGGGKNNAVTYDLLTEYATQPGFPIKPSLESEIIWGEETYASTGDGERLVKDYAMVVRARNPMSSTNPTTVLIFAGASTCGTHAASQAFSADRWFGRSGDLAALIECRVRDGFPIQTSVVAKARRRRGGRAWILVDGDQ